MLRNEFADREVFAATERFVRERVHDASMLTWAAKLAQFQEPEREAIRSVVDYPRGNIEEPFQSAWRLLVESWKQPEFDSSLKAVQIAEELKRGLNPSFLIDDVVRLVTPQLKISATGQPMAGRRRPTTPSELLYIQIDSGDLITLSTVGFEDIQEARIFSDLLDRVYAALCYGLAWAERLGRTTSWAINWVTRVSWLADGEGFNDTDDDPDRFRGGYAAACRLYSEVIVRLAGLSPELARRAVGHLANDSRPLPKRLWAAAARDGNLVAGEELGQWIRSLTVDEFWDIDGFPEMAEVRARRFSDLSEADQAYVEARLRERPPVAHYRKGLDRSVRESHRTQRVAEELQRIVVAGNKLSSDNQKWLARRNLSLPAEDRTIDTGLYDRDAYVPKGRASSFSVSDGAQLLSALERDLTGRLYVDGRRAFDFIDAKLPEIFDLVRTQPDPSKYPRVWSAVAASARDHAMVQNEEGKSTKLPFPQLLQELSKLPDEALAKGVEGISYWMATVEKPISLEPAFRKLWLSVWPGAARMADVELDQGSDDNQILDRGKDKDRLANDSLNSPAGRLMSSFLAMLPNLKDVPRPFDEPDFAEIRDAILQSSGYARRQGLFRLLIALPYMLNADSDWTNTHLLAPLSSENEEDASLWDAISRVGLLPDDTLVLIEDQMRRATVSPLVPSEVRARLGERLILPVARALASGKKPAVELPKLQQMLRLGDERLRSTAATALVRWLKGKEDDLGDRYLQSVRPILRDGWPHDRGAISPEISKALAPLPAATESAIVEAVDDISDLLVPFDVWSLWAYGLYADRGTDERRQLKFPRNLDEATALLKLVDLTIGDSEGAIVPHDLGVFLQKVAEVAPGLTRTPAYSRLATLARR